MDFSFIWQSFVLILAGILLVRVSGRKSIAQMTLSQTILMLSIGTIIVQPIVEKSILKAIGAAAVFVATVLVVDYLQLKFNAIEKFITGKAKVVIENGEINQQNLKKLRLSVDQLEMRMRNLGISKIGDVKYATIEPNGLLGYELIDDAKPLTTGEFKQLMNSFLAKSPNQTEIISPRNQDAASIFEELDGKQKNNPSYLQ
ncbi:DUF421 domain-containing protein [Bacillus sp. AFS073361]|uniref:DUF421 domain-containing protein n=1 Tax=Bacillus sp. AFS073361 TaxID=2033511 RepID=UPI00211D5370|nr:DUF421 domain-containing protein [Bacillus sp. AFS073361]